MSKLVTSHFHPVKNMDRGLYHVHTLNNQLNERSVHIHRIVLSNTGGCSNGFDMQQVTRLLSKNDRMSENRNLLCMSQSCKSALLFFFVLTHIFSLLYENRESIMLIRKGFLQIAFTCLPILSDYAGGSF